MMLFRQILQKYMRPTWSCWMGEKFQKGTIVGKIQGGKIRIEEMLVFSPLLFAN